MDCLKVFLRFAFECQDGGGLETLRLTCPPSGRIEIPKEYKGGPLEFQRFSWALLAAPGRCPYGLPTAMT